MFVKPARGSASLAISKVSDANYLDLMLAQGDGLMIQEFLDGQEIGADVYVDIVSGKVVSIFTKKSSRCAPARPTRPSPSRTPCSSS